MLKPLSFCINSTVDFASILNRQFRDACVLPLEIGPIHGLVQVLPLPNLRISLIQCNKEIAIYANRSPDRLTFTVDLCSEVSASKIIAQGVSISRPAIFGFNSCLKDLDLHMNANSCLCSVVIPVDHLKSVLHLYKCSGLTDFFNDYNIFSSELVSAKLSPILKALFSSDPLVDSFTEQQIEDNVVSILLECFEDNHSRKLGTVLNRKDRHAAAMKIVSMTNYSPRKPFEIQDISLLLHQSRTSLFSGCKEKFGMSPIEVVRSVRLHQVRHALLNTEFCIENNLDGVVDIATHFGFVGRSHFARCYKQHFLETPRQTLASRRANEKFF